MTDQRLTDELEKALRDEAYDGGFGYMGDEQFPAYVRTLAETAAEVFEKAHTPTDDEREALADRLARRLIDDPEQLMLAEGTGALHVALSESIRSTIEDVYADCGDSDPGVLSSNIARRLAWDLPPAILSAVGFRRTEVPEPSAEGYAEFEGWEQEMFRHQPVLSMADGSIAGCQCLDRVFVEGREDWGTHLASIVTSRLSHESQGEPFDTDLIAWHVEQVEALRPFRRSSSHLKAAMMHAATVRALRAAGVGGVR